MGAVKQQIDKLVKEAGSRQAAKKAAEKWFAKGTRQVNEKGVQYTSKRFKPGKLYVFRYSPIGSRSLPWYDKNPVVLALDKAGGNDVGININLLPLKVREDFLDKIAGQFGGEIGAASIGKMSEKAIQQKHLSINWADAKGFIKGSGYDFAIRQYKPGGKSGQAVVSYENWGRISLCDFADLNGTSYSQLEQLFKKR